jgi:hypothetical protein
VKVSPKAAIKRYEGAMRSNYEVEMRITNTEKGFEVTVSLEDKTTHKKAERKEMYSDLPEDFEPIIESIMSTLKEIDQ